MSANIPEFYTFHLAFYICPQISTKARCACGPCANGGKRAARPLNSEPIFIPAPLRIWPGECTLPSLSVDTGMIIHSLIEFDQFHNLNKTSPPESFLRQRLICGFWSTRILHCFPLSIFLSWHHTFSLVYQTDHTFSESRSLRFQFSSPPPPTPYDTPSCTPVQPSKAQYSPMQLNTV